VKHILATLLLLSTCLALPLTQAHTPKNAYDAAF